MAEYKGLTIRIGGDTSQLNAALKSSTKAASSLQSQIRQITRAMRFDPGNLGNVDTRMRLTTNRAEALYSKITLLKSAYKELGETTVSVGGSATSVKRLAETTENVALAATNAEARYNDMTATLASRYRELEARAKEAGKAMNLNALSRQGTDETFEKQMAQLRELGVVTDEEIQKLREMRATWNEAFDSSEAYKAAEQLQHMTVDMQRLESEARNATATVRELNTVSKYSADNWRESSARIKAMDSALTECTNQARAYEAALREDPSNMSAAIGRLKALQNGYKLAADKAEELTRQVRAYEAELSGTLAKQKNLPQYIKEMGDKWQKVQDELSQAKGEANALRQSLQRLKDQQAPVGKIRQLAAEVRKADERVDALRVSAKSMEKDFETSKECAELQRLQVELSETTARANSLKKRMDLTSLGGKSLLNASTVKSAGMTLYSTLTPVITMLGWRAISAAQDMDSAYRDMRKTVEGTEAQFKELREAAIEFSKTHVTSAEQMLNIMAIGGELGIATESLQAFAETVSNLDVATNLDTEQAASSLGKLANITHMTADQYDNYADALVRLGNNGASTEDQIVDITTRIGSMGTIVGMTVPELLALASSIASTGMKTEASGTAIANTISDIESAVAGGGESLEAFAQVSGMSAEEFAKTWEDKPIAAFEAFIKGLNEVEKSGGSADATLEQMGITGTRQKQAIEGLMQTIGGLDDNLLMSQHAWEGQSDAWGAAGDAAREASKKAEGFSGQLQILKNVANDALAALAEGATPFIAAFTNLAKSALGAFEEMDEGAKSAVVALLGIGVAIGPLLTMASTFVTASQNIKAFLSESSAIGKALNLMKAGFADAGAGATGMQTKIAGLKEAGKTLGKSLLKGLAAGAVVAGIVLVISAIADFIKKMEESKEASRSAGDVIGDALAKAGSESKDALGGIAVSYDDMVSKIAESNRKIQESADETYGNTALIEQYAEGPQDALDAYNAGDRGAESMANLKTQLDLYNGAAGESITFTHDETGALRLMKDGAELSADAFDRLTASLIAASKAKFFQESYETKMGDYRTALDEVEAAEKKVADTEQMIAEARANNDYITANDLTKSLVNYQNELDNAKTKLGETQKAMGQYEEGMKLMAEAQLESAGAGVKWVANNDALQVSLWKSGKSVSDFAHGLDSVGISYSDMEASAEGIEGLAETWDGSLGGMVAGLTEVGYAIDLDAAAIDGLNKIQIAGKTYWVDDKGTVLQQSGKLAGFNMMQIDGKTYWVDDKGTVYDALGEVKDLTDALAGIPGHTSTTVSAKVEGYEAVSSLYTLMQNINGMTYRATVSAGTTSATGSVASSPYIARHASGYIATGPTLTNNGWVGEAGAEAVLNWGTGGAVVPLTNTRYMEPIAGAIAAEMGRLRGSERPQQNITITVNAHTDADPDEIAGAIGNRLLMIDAARGY